MEGFAWTIKSDRPYVLAYFDTVPRRNFWLYSRWCWNLEESEFLEMMEAFLALPNDARPFYHVKKTIHKVNGTFSPTSGPFAQQLFPTLEATYQAVLRTRAKIRCLRVLNALQTHIAAGDNKTPKLTDLGLPAETTTDPFTGGEPLHVKKLPQGWLVYSIGGNDRDDGGNLEGGPNGDIGVGPPPPAKNP
jgi:hypothetical protein